MKVTVKILAELKYLLQSKQETVEMEVPPETTTSQLVERLGIPAHMVSIILVNKKISRRTDIVKEGDTIELLPLVSGG
jgi:sulfur carrier protein ThiS